MSIPHDRTIDADHRIDVILAGYWQAREARQSVDRKALCARHPECAAQLADFFADLDLMERIALPLRSARHAADEHGDARATPALSSSDTVDDAPAQGSSASDSRKIRCPNCQNPIPLSQDSVSVVCPGCGNVIVLRDAQFTNTASEMKSFGKFQLLVRLGMGSFGAVWKARDTELDRIIALKIPHSGLLTEREVLERFQREARAAAQLRHPNIVSVHEVARLNNLPVIVAEFVPGVPLKDFLEVRELSFRQSAALTAQVADALEYAHSLGVVHRDIKPANLMLLDSQGKDNPAGDSASSPTKDELADVGKPMILDFGLALRDAIETTMTVDGQKLGTPAYMSPEQAAGQSHKADRRSDVYSLGVVLYQMLTGDLPFRGSQRMLLHQVLNDEPKAPRKINDKIPRDLETICLTCLRKEPGRRYQRAEALAADLRRFLIGEPIAARRVSAPEQLIRWVKRRPAVAGLIAASFLALLGMSMASVVWIYNNKLAAAKDKTDGFNLLLKESQAKTNDALEKSDTYLYLNRIGLAARSWWDGNPNRTRELLELCPLARRGWEWNYLERLSHSEIKVLAGHGSVVGAATYSPDGKWIASIGNDNLVRIWIAETGEVLAKLPHGPEDEGSVAFSPDGTLLAAAGGYNTGGFGTLKLWDLTPLLKGTAGTNIKERWVKEIHLGDTPGLCFTPDGLRLGVATGALVDRPSQAVIYNVMTGEELLTLNTTHVGCLSIGFSPDGSLAATGSGAGDTFSERTPGDLQIWDASTGKEIKRIAGHNGYVNCVAFSPNGKILASAGSDRFVKFWDTESFHEIPTLCWHDALISSIAFRPDGKQLASADWIGVVKVWDINTFQDLFTLRGHTSEVLSVAYNPRGDRLVTAGFDATIRIWDATTGQEAVTLSGHTAGVRGVAFSPDQTRILSGSHDHTLRIHDSDGKNPSKTLATLDENVWCVAFSPDGKKIAAGSGDWANKDKPGKEHGQITVWDYPSGNFRFRQFAHAGLPWCIVFSPDGKRLASAGGETGTPGDVKIWDTASGAELQSFAYPDGGGFTCVAFSPDGSRLAAGAWAGRSSGSNIARIWDEVTGKEQLTIDLETDSPWCLTFSRDGKKLFTGGRAQQVKMWDAFTGQLLAKWSGHADDVKSLAVNSDGSRLASCSLDQTIRLWDVVVGEELLVLKGHKDYVYGVAFSADGNFLVSGSDDKTVRIWDGRPSAEASKQSSGK